MSGTSSNSNNKNDRALEEDALMIAAIIKEH